MLPAVSIGATAAHLAEISTQVTPGAHAVVVLDGAGWHTQGDRLHVPHNLTLLPLPPYAPEPNPVGNIWDYLRSNQLSITVWPTTKQIIDACCRAWNALIHEPARITSIASRDWAQVNK